ncbi:MAG: hypothetical protein IPP47_28335 [Bryobacterales bacterium]|nr:hypothetical protein [Bryobacterales bacterium]
MTQTLKARYDWQSILDRHQIDAVRLKTEDPLSAAMKETAAGGRSLTMAPQLSFFLDRHSRAPLPRQPSTLQPTIEERKYANGTLLKNFLREEDGQDLSGIHSDPCLCCLGVGRPASSTAGDSVRRDDLEARINQARAPPARHLRQ